MNFSNICQKLSKIPKKNRQNFSKKYFIPCFLPVASWTILFPVLASEHSCIRIRNSAIQHANSKNINFILRPSFRFGQKIFCQKIFYFFCMFIKNICLMILFFGWSFGSGADLYIKNGHRKRVMVQFCLFLQILILLFYAEKST